MEKSALLLQLQQLLAVFLLLLGTFLSLRLLFFELLLQKRLEVILYLVSLLLSDSVNHGSSPAWYFWLLPSSSTLHKVGFLLAVAHSSSVSHVSIFNY